MKDTPNVKELTPIHSILDWGPHNITYVSRMVNIHYTGLLRKNVLPTHNISAETHVMLKTTYGLVACWSKAGGPAIQMLVLNS